MNERIDELAREAAGGMLSYDEDGYRLSEREVKKFAELIIRECASLAYDGPSGILEHFGVEDQPWPFY